MPVSGDLGKKIGMTQVFDDKRRGATRSPVLQGGSVRGERS